MLGQLLDVQPILQSPDRSFVGDEIIAVNYEQTDSSVFAYDSSLPGGFELDPVDTGNQIDSVWWNTKLYHLSRNGEISGFEADIPKAEIIKCQQHTLGIVRRGADPEVDVLGEPRPTMKGNGVAAYQKIVNGSSVQALDKLYEIFAQAHLEALGTHEHIRQLRRDAVEVSSHANTTFPLSQPLGGKRKP